MNEAERAGIPRGERILVTWFWHPRHWGWEWPKRTTGIYAQTFYREGQFGPLELRWRTRA